MNGYIETGYIVVLGSLGLYGVSLVRREQLARRRLSRTTTGTIRDNASPTGASDSAPVHSDQSPTQVRRDDA